MRLGIELDFWDDFVGAFEPEKVVRQVLKAFPATEVDPTDHQEVRLLAELEHWAQQVGDSERRQPMIRSSWHLYKTCGPSYHFVIPLPSGHRVSGESRRLSVSFRLPAGVPTEQVEALKTFLQSLRMGEPVLEVDGGA